MRRRSGESPELLARPGSAPVPGRCRAHVLAALRVAVALLGLWGPVRASDPDLRDRAEVAPRPSVAPAPSVLEQARRAFQTGRFGEPAGANAIELARRASRDGSVAPEARNLEQRAAAAYENQARAAVVRGERERARRIYVRLFTLFPDRDAYLRQVEALRIPDIRGVWTWQVQGLLRHRATVTFLADRTCRADGFLGVGRTGGTYACTDPALRVFVISWKHGATDTLTLSADGQRLEGTNNLRMQVSGNRARRP